MAMRDHAEIEVILKHFASNRDPNRPILSGVFRILHRGPRPGGLWGLRSPEADGFVQIIFIHKILMSDDSRCVKLQERNTN
jgi:hypothetical protein